MSKGMFNLFLIIGVAVLGVVTLVAFSFLDRDMEPVGSNRVIEDVKIQKLKSQGSSDQASSIQSDIEATEIDTLDEDLKDLETSIKEL